MFKFIFNTSHWWQPSCSACLRTAASLRGEALVAKTATFGCPAPPQHAHVPNISQAHLPVPYIYMYIYIYVYIYRCVCPNTAGVSLRTAANLLCSFQDISSIQVTVCQSKVHQR